MSESFAHRVRSELAHVRPPRECCRRAMLVAFVRGAGAQHNLPCGRLELEKQETQATHPRPVYKTKHNL
ncbi:MAG: hypothetical protein ACRDJM_03915, partial [Actinomycetota bacterium]